MKKSYLAPETNVVSLELQLMTSFSAQLTNDIIDNPDDIGARDYDMDDDWD